MQTLQAGPVRGISGKKNETRTQRGESRVSSATESSVQKQKKQELSKTKAGEERAEGKERQREEGDTGEDGSEGTCKGEGKSGEPDS